jgi:hypothetical protein
MCYGYIFHTNSSKGYKIKKSISKKLICKLTLMYEKDDQ